MKKRRLTGDPVHRHAFLGLLCLFTGLVSATPTELDDLRRQQAYLRSLSLAQLVELDVTSVSRRPQQLADAAAAIFVVTSEDIRRSGVTSIPEALRMVPGVQVARLDASKWAITARGFNNRFANKLLVLIDGRSVYTSLFSGVYWDEQDLMLEDVERIEVIRGPGATLWGANAVNGVINIVSKNSADTQGNRLVASLGSEEKGSISLRHGGALDDNRGHYRLYTKLFERDGGLYADGGTANDDWRKASAGGRLDLRAGNGDNWVLDGRVYQGKNGQFLTVPAAAPPFAQIITNPVLSKGGHLLGRWEGKRGGHSNLRLQGYFDHVVREDPAGFQRVNTFDLDFQHRYTGIQRHELIWGLGLRYIDHQVTPGQIANPIDPGDHDLSLFSAFIQDEIALLDERLKLTFGSKFEHNDFTGFELQPNLRAAWKATRDSTLWGSVSRAVRTPSIFERDGNIPFYAQPGALPLLASFNGSPGFGSESLIAYELGYRFNPDPTLNLDFATYYNDYDELTSAELGTPSLQPGPPPYALQPFIADNLIEAQGYGIEAAIKWHPRSDLRFDLAYTWQMLDMSLKAGSTDQFSLVYEGSDPRNQLSLRASWDPAADWELDAWLRYVDELPHLQVDAYLTLDLRAAWRPRPGLEISLVAQNLFDTPREEFRSLFVQNPSTQLQQGFYLKLDWKL